MTNHEHIQEVFGHIYHTKGWGLGESVSGRGSSLLQTQRLIDQLPNIFREYNIHSILDIPCGDWNWMKKVDLQGIEYAGADIVPEIIQGNAVYASGQVHFHQWDLVISQLPKFDLVLVRDCLVHFPYHLIHQAIKNVIASQSTWLLTTTFPGRSANRDIPLGRWRPLNLESAPFCWPTPQKYLFECCTEGGGRFADKSLGLWKLETLRLLGN